MVIQEGNYGKERFIVQKLLELLCCIIAMLAIWQLLKDETKEIEWSNKQHGNGHNSQIFDGNMASKIYMNHNQQ